MIDRQYALRVSAHTGSEVSPHAAGQHELGRFSAGKVDRKGLEGPAGIRKYLKGLLMGFAKPAMLPGTRS